MKKSSRRSGSTSSYFLKFGVFSLLAMSVVGASVLLTRSLSTTDSRSKAAALSDTFVTRQGTKFYLGSQEFKFVGFNLFDAAGNSASPYSCLQTNGWWPKFTDAEIDSGLKSMKSQTGATVLRFWAFQKYTNNGTNFAGIDRIIQLAKLNGFKVLPVLEDGPGYCTEPGGGGNNHLEKWKYANDTWYTEGYKIPNSPYTLSYRDYVKTIVTRYKDDPTILGWMLVNEADTSRKVTSADGKQQTALVPFATDMGNLVKSIDTNHLLTVGTQSNGASGGTGQDFIDLYSLPQIDFTEAHDWGYWGSDTDAIPGGIKNADGSMSLPDPLSADCLKTYQAKIGCAMAQSVQIVKKPMVIGESGIAANSDDTRLRRSQLMSAKMKAFFDNQGAGYLYWQWNKVVDSQQYDVLANTNDPLLPVMKSYAGLAIGPLVTPIPTTMPSPSPKPSPTPIPTAFPFPSPRPSASPSPIVVSPKPTPSPPISPTPSPSSSPVPSPIISSILEGESMILDSGTGQKVVDTAAAGGKSLLLLTNSLARGTIAGPINKILVRANPVWCLGNPHINVKVNGNYVMDQNITLSGYNDYATGNLSYMNLGSGNWPVEINYNNDASFWVCNRNVYIDRIVAQ